MMETFIVLGLCFILYEALDLFQSCYNNQQQHPQTNDDIDCTTNTSSNNCNSSSTICARNSNNATTNDIDTASVNKDTARLVTLDSIDEIDSEDNQSNQFANNKVFSICDRVVVDNVATANVNDNGNLIAGWNCQTAATTSIKTRDEGTSKIDSQSS